MEKLSVVTAAKASGTKESATNVNCPLCGAVLGYDTNVPKCPVHGTRPWEADEHEGRTVPAARLEREETGIPVPDELDNPLEVPQINMAVAIDNYYRKLTQEVSRRSFGIHVTNAVSAYGSRCDLSLQMQVMHAPVDPIRWAPMYSRFDIGHGFHDSVYRVIEQAFELAYGGTWTAEWHIEQGIDFPGTFITGTPDAVMTLRPKGNEQAGAVRIVLDVKSVSPKALESYRKKSGGITPPKHYRSQVQVYTERLKASAAMILWVSIEKPFAKYHSWVPPNPKVLRGLEVRANKAAQAEADGVILPPNVGSWCSQCPYQAECDRLTGAHSG